MTDIGRRTKTIPLKMVERRKRERKGKPVEKRKRAERKRRSARMRVKRYVGNYYTSFIVLFTRRGHKVVSSRLPCGKNLKLL